MKLVPRSLLDRVFLLYAVMMTVILIVGLALYLNREIEEQIDRNADSAGIAVEILAQAVSDSAIVNDLEAVRRQLDTAVNRTAFWRARYVDGQGDALSAISTTRAVSVAPSALRAWVGQQLPEIDRAVRFGGRDYGVLRLEYDIDHVADSIWSIVTSVFAFGAASLVIGLVVTRAALRRWLANFQRLGAIAERIQAGEFDASVGISGDAPEEVRRALQHFQELTSGLRDGLGRRIEALSRALVQHKRATDQALIVTEFDAGGRLLVVNELFCTVSGWSHGEVQGRTGVWGLDPDQIRHAAEVAKAGDCWSGEAAAALRNGEPIALRRAVVAVLDESGGLEKFICLDIDIRREKAAERRLMEEKERAEVTLHSIAEGVLTLDEGGAITYANASAERILGIDCSLIVHRPLSDVIQVLDPGPQATWPPSGSNALSDVRLPGGQHAVLASSAASLPGAGGAVVGKVLAFRDVTTEQRTQRELERLSLVVQHSASGILITNPRGVIEYVNARFTTLTGYAAAEAIGQRPSLLKSGQTEAAVYHDMWESLKAGRAWRGELLNRRKNGSLFWCALTLTAVLDDDGRPRQFVSVLEDVSDQKTAQETIHRLAYYDSLTELPNRRMFMERSVQLLRAAREQGQGAAICYLDLDGFKNVNDTLGHPVGDALLIEIGHRINGCLRNGDFLGRLGGDEFALLLRQATTPAAVEAVGRRLIEAIEQPVIVDGEQMFVSTSIGAAVFPDDGQDITDLLRKADMALYRAKELGKRRLVFHTREIEELRRDRADIETALRDAVARQELSLVYQPKVELATGLVTGAEALLRWNHPTKGAISPDLFIPLAEETRLVVPIGNWVLATACRQLRDWSDAGLTDIRLAVNLSTVQLRSPDLVGEVRAHIARSGVRPEQIELEITESGLIEDPQRAAVLLGRLRDIGLTVAIDDFGTGYSSLAYLKSFPFNVLKVDRSFVRDLENDSNDLGIAEAVVSMARVLKVDVVAEGVETDGQRRILQRMGCGYGQGYLFSRPLAPEAFARFWRENRGRAGVEAAGAARPAGEAELPLPA